MIQVRYAAAVCAAAIAIAAGVAATPAMATEPLPINVGWVQTPGHLAPLLDVLAQKHPAVMPHDGKTYSAKAIRFKGTTAQIQAMAANQLEVASFAPSALALAITNAQLDVRVVADVIQEGAHGYFDQPYVVRKEGPIKTIADVKGKHIATNTIGSASDAAMRVMFAKHGIKNEDFTTVEANFASMVSMIEENKVDLIPVMPQFEHRLNETGKFRTLFTMGQAIGPSQTVLWAIRGDFIKAHRPVLIDFFEDHIRGVRWFLDPKNRAEALTIAEQVTKQKPEDLAYAFTKKDFYRSPDGRPNMKAAQLDIDDAAKLHVIPKAVKLAPKYVDLSLIEEAKKRIDQGK